MPSIKSAVGRSQPRISAHAESDLLRLAFAGFQTRFSETARAEPLPRKSSNDFGTASFWSRRWARADRRLAGSDPWARRMRPSHFSKSWPQSHIRFQSGRLGFDRGKCGPNVERGYDVWSDRIPQVKRFEPSFCVDTHWYGLGITSQDGCETVEIGSSPDCHGRIGRNDHNEAIGQQIVHIFFANAPRGFDPLHLSSSAEKNTSAGAPATICRARVRHDPNEKLTLLRAFVVNWGRSCCIALVKLAAAKTRMSSAKPAPAKIVNSATTCLADV